jgi:hypothetical protein
MKTTPNAASTNRRLSVPVRTTAPPRQLSDTESATLLRIADCLIPASGPNPKASDAEDYQSFLQLALGARSDVFDKVMAGVAAFADVPDDKMWAALKDLWSRDRETFDPLSAIVAGAYFMTPQIMELIGYPGQHRDPAPVELAANEIEGLIDPVIERGPIYVSAAGE